MTPSLVQGDEESVGPLLGSTPAIIHAMIERISAGHPSLEAQVAIARLREAMFWLGEADRIRRNVPPA